MYIFVLPSFYIYTFLSFAPILSIFYFGILVLVSLGIVLYVQGTIGGRGVQDLDPSR